MFIIIMQLCGRYHYGLRSIPEAGEWILHSKKESLYKMINMLDTLYTGNKVVSCEKYRGKSSIFPPSKSFRNPPPNIDELEELTSPLLSDIETYNVKLERDSLCKKISFRLGDARIEGKKCYMVYYFNGYEKCDYLPPQYNIYQDVDTVKEGFFELDSNWVIYFREE